MELNKRSVSKLHLISVHYSRTKIIQPAPQNVWVYSRRFPNCIRNTSGSALKLLWNKFTFRVWPEHIFFFFFFLWRFKWLWNTLWGIQLVERRIFLPRIVRLFLRDVITLGHKFPNWGSWESCDTSILQWNFRYHRIFVSLQST